MNPLYCTLEAAQRLEAAGIVLETEKVWALSELPVTIDGHVAYKEGWKLIDKPMIRYKQQTPAPSMAEVWRELPTTMFIRKFGNQLWVWQEDFLSHSVNPADALIDLLIWVTEDRRRETKQ